MTLLVSTLLLIVGGALILTTSMSAGLAVDSTAELQAYYSAEAGVNASLNVLRGNIQSNPAGTQATFANAITNPTLSNWLNYNGTINGTSVVQLNANPLTGYTVAVSSVANQPSRLIVRVTGYGPKASLKRMELEVDSHSFDFSPVAAILLRGNDDNTTPLATFNIGNSNAKSYSGWDNAVPGNSLPTFGVSHSNDFNVVTNEINTAKPNTTTGKQKVNLFTNAQLPTFLQTADNARALLTDMHSQAASNGRYFTSTPGSLGTTSNPQLTFVDGNCDLTTNGAGLLIVTGTLHASGNPSFDGLILVLGDGVFLRNGGGNGDTLGAIVLAKFARSWPSSDNANPHPFLSPTYDMSGGGNSITGYDSAAVDKALAAAGVRSLAVREY
jgi:hypothetical protein